MKFGCIRDRLHVVFLLIFALAVVVLVCFGDVRKRCASIVSRTSPDYDTTLLAANIIFVEFRRRLLATCQVFLFEPLLPFFIYDTAANAIPATIPPDHCRAGG